MTTANNARFNAEAAAWDSNPSVLLASDRAHKAILARLQPAPASKQHSAGLDVLELGCGTGILTLALAPHVRWLTAVDAAEGMIAALKTKLSAPGSPTNIGAVCMLLEDPDDGRLKVAGGPGAEEGDDVQAPPRFDLVISHLVLHHIPDLRALFKTMIGCLKPGGSVMLTDFENFGPEARRFHPESKMDGVERHGIERAEMEALLKEVGFVDVAVETAFQMEKAVETEPGSGVMGPTMIFPFLICMGRKPV